MDKGNYKDLKWEINDLLDIGIDENLKVNLDSIIKTEYKKINGVVLVRKGCVAFENYYNGYHKNSSFHVASVTKSIISALVGIAIDKGYIESVNQKVLDFFPEYEVSRSDINKKSITIKNLLTMTAPYPFKKYKEPLERLCKQKDWIKFILDMLGQKGQIGEFKYSSSGAHLLSAIIGISTGKSALEFANSELFSKIGMNEIQDYEMVGFGYEDLFGKKLKGWAKDTAGNSTGGWGIKLSARDMTRFGYLYLNKGYYNGQQIIPESWIDESIIINSNNYGYLWWLREEEGVFSYLAMGDGGNIICCIPDKEIVISIASTITPKPKDIFKLIDNYILLYAL